MKPSDYQLILSFETHFKYGVQDYISTKCENCDLEREVGVSITLSDFFPISKDRSSVRSRILPDEAPVSSTIGDSENVIQESTVVQEETHERTGRTEQTPTVREIVRSNKRNA